MDIKKILMITFGLMILVIVSACTGAVTSQVTSDTQTKESETKSEDSTQVVMLGMKNGRYTPDPINVQQGKEVILKNDGSLMGCALNTMSPDLGINADFVNQKEYRFTPEEKGTFEITCPMGMFKGTVNVV